MKLLCSGPFLARMPLTSDSTRAVASQLWTRLVSLIFTHPAKVQRHKSTTRRCLIRVCKRVALPREPSYPETITDIGCPSTLSGPRRQPSRRQRRTRISALHAPALSLRQGTSPVYTVTVVVGATIPGLN